MARRFDENRREELLDGVMRIISARGFSDITTMELAGELHCSGSTLYKIGASKDSVVALAMTHWSRRKLAEMEDRALADATPAARARLYWQAGAETIRPLSHAFRRDVDRFEWARLVYRTSLSEPFIDRFRELLDEAVDAGELEPMNTCFLAQALRQIAFLVRDEQVLGACGITADQAMLEVDRMIWNGLRRPSVRPVLASKV
jgi:AcrR family transcriptional regulator